MMKTDFIEVSKELNIQMQDTDHYVEIKLTENT